MAAERLDGRERRDRTYLYRIDRPATDRRRVRFLSLEPLLGAACATSISTGSTGSSSAASPGRARGRWTRAWVIDIRDQCLAAGVPFFFKQWGGTNKKKAGRLLDGRTWDEMPRDPGGRT